MDVENVVALVVAVLVLLVYMRLCWVVCFTIPANQKKMLKAMRELSRQLRA